MTPLKFTICLLVCYFACEVSAGKRVREIISKLPQCSCKALVCTCCAKFDYKEEEQTVCLNTDFNIAELKMTVEIVHNDHVVASRQIGPNSVPICLPVPGTPFTTCITAKEINLATTGAKACTMLSVNAGPLKLYQRDLPCMTLTDGALKLTKN